MNKMMKDAIMYVVIACMIWGIAGIVSPAKGLLVGEVAYGAFTKALRIIIAVFFIIGLIQVWVSPQTLSKILGREAGWKGLALALTIPIFIGGSLFTIFPLLKTLREKGASIAAVLAFIAAWGGKAPLLPLEIEFLGVRFGALRILLIIPFAVAVGVIGERIMENRPTRSRG